MSQRVIASEDVEGGHPLLDGGETNNLVVGEAVEVDDSGKQYFSIGAEGLCARSSPIAQANGTYHDRGWAYAFYTSVVITIVAAVCFGTLALEAISTDRKHGGWGSRHLSDSRHEFRWLSTLVVGFGLVAIVVGFAMFILHALVNCGKPVVWSSIALISLAWLRIIAYFAETRMTFLAVSTSAVYGIIAYAIYRERARFPLGAVTLKVAAMAIKSMPGTIFTSLLMIGVQLAWISVSLVAALGSFGFMETVEGSDGSMHRAIYCATQGQMVSHGTPECYCMGEKVSEDACQYSGWGFPLVVLWFVPMQWGLSLMKNVVTCTVSGSVAAWWYSPNDVKPVKGALYRATHHSFGTLCKAAFFVNITSFLMSTARAFFILVPGASCLFRAAFAGFFYLLNYAVTFVGVYGVDLAGALSRVRKVFARRGATSLANDSIVNFAISFLSFSMAFAFGVVMFVMLKGILVEVGPSFQILMTLGFGFIAFVFTIGTVLEVVRSAVKAVLVCFIQDPEILKNTRGDELHNEFISAWVKIHPEDEARDVMVRAVGPLNTTHAQTH